MGCLFLGNSLGEPSQLLLWRVGRAVLWPFVRREEPPGDWGETPCPVLPHLSLLEGQAASHLHTHAAAHRPWGGC